MNYFGGALRERLYLAIVILVCLHFTEVLAQHFDPSIDDKSYLDQIESDIQAEVDLARQILREQAKYTQDVARNYAGAKMKENLFVALRVLAEKEQEAIRLAKKELENKQSKQEEEEEEDGAETTTTRRPSNFIPVGNLVKAFFGSNSINLTSYVESASRFLPSPVGTQLLGVVKMIAHDPARLTTLPPPQTTIITIINGTNGTQAFTTVNGTQVPVRVQVLSGNSTTEESGTDEEEEEGGEEDSRKTKNVGRQINLSNLPNLTPTLNFLGMLFGGPRPTEAPAQNVRRRGTTRPVAVEAAPAAASAAVVVNGTTESAAGFEEEKEDTMQQFSLDGLANSVRQGLGDMIRIAPDIFKGAREAVNLISGLSSFIGDLDL